MTDRDTINRVLAERVMGWRETHTGVGDDHFVEYKRNGVPVGFVKTRPASDLNRGGNVLPPDALTRYLSVWNPMDNIAQAMMVADRLHEIGKMSNPAVYHQLMLRYDVFRNYEGALMWTASFGTGGRGDANTPAEAISRAAYEVVKGEQ